ncbi:ankyrin repeat domain-containing protein SOWAHA [Echeneis naucrates]|uniref:Ankyrin repeat domain-containing protein SOWAHA-like n=1 Tax=Echeneis naucrates TaxID=173247 RepID=A0A665T156_ECHNA|nr:ankyrin repeat domain-containing protein SOWAHA-like [Echeneis naucrates]
MDLTQESVLSLLISEGGKIKKSDLVLKFRSAIHCVDPAEEERNKDLFKTFVNNVAFVREIGGVRHVVLKKMYQHLLDSVPTERSENEGISQAGEQQRPPVQTEDKTESQKPDSDQEGESGENPAELLSPIQLALRRSKYGDVRIKRMLNFEISNDNCPRRGEVNEAATSQRKPHALPLRMSPSATKLEIRKLKDDPPESPKLDAHSGRRGASSAQTASSISSLQLRRVVKTTKASEEHKDTRIPSVVPLEQPEHDWLVKCAAGHWSLVYGLLLTDYQLAEKRDFMSGFTALHWAAKCGNSDMLVKIVDLSRGGGLDVDINAKTHGGHTPLHIAALHNQEYFMAMLVGEYGANVSIRDNCGKKAYHYLRHGISETLREMLGGSKASGGQERTPHEKEELDLFPDVSKGLQSISRLFQPHLTGQRKKHKQRPGFYSLSDEPSEEREDGSRGSRQRVVSDAFM